MTTTTECIFCTMARDPMHVAPVYRDDRVFAVKDINPKAPVHMLIIPNMHIASLAYVGPGQVPIMGHMFVVAEEIARREGVALSGYRLVLNQGEDSGQEILHPHMHLLGGKQLGAMG
ncbi:MAG: HIT domain-containing protein [Chloroflexi bacterium]|nr:HIT domain-containing protein [Chloroflexota bacterium]